MDMNEEQLKEALEHDGARKQAEAGAGNGGEAEGAEVQQSTVATAQLVDTLDIKNAYLAKSVSMVFIDFARGCCILASTAVTPAVDITGQPKGLQLKTKEADQLLEFAERAVKIARELDVLGDKDILREMRGAEDQTVR